MKRDMMPVILSAPDEVETWMTAQWKDARKLQRPLPNGVLQIVAVGGKEDPEGQADELLSLFQGETQNVHRIGCFEGSFRFGRTEAVIAHCPTFPFTISTARFQPTGNHFRPGVFCERLDNAAPERRGVT